MTKFHSDDYIKFLRSIRPDNMSEYSKLLQRLVTFCTVAYISYRCSFYVDFFSGAGPGAVLLQMRSVSDSVAEPVHFCAAPAPTPAPACQKFRLRLQLGPFSPYN
jgi:hypothetical protein